MRLLVGVGWLEVEVYLLRMIVVPVIFTRRLNNKLVIQIVILELIFIWNFEDYCGERLLVDWGGQALEVLQDKLIIKTIN